MEDHEHNLPEERPREKDESQAQDAADQNLHSSESPEGAAPLPEEGAIPPGGYPPPEGYPSQGQAYPPAGGYPSQGQGYPPQGGYQSPSYASYSAMPLKQKTKQPNGSKRRAWPWVLAGGVLLVAAVVVVLLTVVLPTGGGGSALVYNPVSPMFYAEDDAYYVTAGEESIELEDIQAADYGLNAAMDAGKTYLYYLADAKHGEGALMRLKLNDAAAEPETCAEDVCSADISNDGSRVLLLRDIDDGVGDLYLWTVSGEEKLDTSVVVDSYRFSPNGQNLSYTKADSGDSEDKTFCLKIGGAAPEEVADVEGIYVYGYPLDDGALLYMAEDEDYNGTLYRYANGNEDRLGDGYLYAIFNSRELLYKDGNKLYYYKNGSRERISKECQDVAFAQKEVSTVDYSSDKHFVLAEGSEDDMVLYDCVLGRDPVKITKTDYSWVMVSNNFDWVAYRNNGTQYLAHKKGNEWEDRIKVITDVNSSSFDKKGRYLYVLDNDGEFGRYILASSEYEELYDDVTSYQLIGDDIYVVTEDQELYRVTATSDELIAENASINTETYGGGFYVVVASDGSQDIEYYAANSTDGKSVAYDVDDTGVYIRGYISYYPDVEEESGY